MSLLVDNLSEIETDLLRLADEIDLEWMQERDIADRLEALARALAVEIERINACA